MHVLITAAGILVGENPQLSQSNFLLPLSLDFFLTFPAGLTVFGVGDRGASERERGREQSRGRLRLAQQRQPIKQCNKITGATLMGLSHARSAD